jgi:hypothetical protein
MWLAASLDDEGEKTHHLYRVASTTIINKVMEELPMGCFINEHSLLQASPQMSIHIQGIIVCQEA